MVQDAEAHAAEDKLRKEEVEERNLADSAAYRSEKSIADLGDKITPEQKTELESKIADVRAALTTDDVARIKDLARALEQAFTKSPDRSIAQALPTPLMGQSSRWRDWTDRELLHDTIEGE
jgi:molecular chaperone DnaK